MFGVEEKNATMFLKQCYNITFLSINNILLLIVVQSREINSHSGNDLSAIATIDP